MRKSRCFVSHCSSILQYATVSQHFSIAATYCEPDSGPSSALQILTHGIGFDRSYWDLPFHHYNYSYVNVAVDDYGFSTFTYDRPGIGESLPHPNPLTVEQALLEVDALYQLTLLLQAFFFNVSESFEIYKSQLALPGWLVRQRRLASCTIRFLRARSIRPEDSGICCCQWAASSNWRAPHYRW